MALTKRFGDFQPFVQQAGGEREAGLSLGIITYQDSLDNDSQDYLITSLSLMGRSDHLMDGVHAFRGTDAEVLSSAAPLKCDEQLLRTKSETKTTKVVIKPSDAVLTEAVA